MNGCWYDCIQFWISRNVYVGSLRLLALSIESTDCGVDFVMLFCPKMVETPGVFDLIQTSPVCMLKHGWADHSCIKKSFFFFKAEFLCKICNGEIGINSNSLNPFIQMKSFHYWVSRKDSQWQRLLEEYAKEISVTCELRRALAEAG